MTFLEKLDILIRSKGLNKHSFAKECGIPYTTVDYWYKKNTDKVKLDTVRQISAFFGVSLNYWKENEGDALALYKDYVEYLPYLADADQRTIDAIRVLLRMPQDEKKSVCASSHTEEQYDAGMSERYGST